MRMPSFELKAAGAALGAAFGTGAFAVLVSAAGVAVALVL